MNFIEVSKNSIPFLIKGLRLTVYIGSISLLLALLIGLIGGIFNKNSKVFIIRTISRIYVTVVRGTPFLIQLYLVFFVLHSFGITLNPLQAGILALAFHNGAYIAEIIRSGIEAIPKEQSDAAISLGMTPFLKMKLIILPQALRIVIPPLMGQIMILIKDTSITSLIGIFELTKVGRELTVASRFNPIVVYTWVSFFYFIICYPLYVLSIKLEKKLRLHFSSL